MFDYRAEVERRIDQFTLSLGQMNKRSHDIAQGSCFMIFSEEPSEPTDGQDELVESKEISLELVAKVFQGGGLVEAEETVLVTIPGDGWREDDSQARFVQFSFEEKWFCMDMPLQTLFRAEAEQILRGRQGFFFLKDRPEFTLKEEDVDGYDPFRKIYVYGDERSAAEDMAYIWFVVWKFPVDWRFYVTASSFESGHSWEDNKPME